jgi:GGDEF domain-containing protein
VVEEWHFPGVPRAVTISAGAATFPDHGVTRDQLVKAADAGLYAAKQAGRNKVFSIAPLRANPDPANRNRSALAVDRD